MLFRSRRSTPTPGLCWRRPNNSLRIKALNTVFEYNPKLTTKRAGNYRPFFLVDCFSLAFIAQHQAGFKDVALQEIVAQTVAGLGYDLVEIERSAGGLLRITIDLPWVAPVDGQVSVEQFVNVEELFQLPGENADHDLMDALRAAHPSQMEEVLSPFLAHEALETRRDLMDGLLSTFVQIGRAHV